jgi:hypothetical protein
MAVLRTLTKIQREKIEAAKVVKTPPRSLNVYDAHVVAYRLANYTGKVSVIPAKRALKANKWYQSDYRSFTPKGVVLVSSKLRGTCKRFANA